MLKGFQTLTKNEQVAAACIAAKAGHDFFVASHIWYAAEAEAVLLRFKSGVDALIAPTYQGC